MSITDVILRKDDGSRGKDGDSYERTFLVKLNEPINDINIIFADYRIPKLQTLHPHNAGYEVVSVTPEFNDDTRTILDVVVSYDKVDERSYGLDSFGDGGEPNPLLAEDQISFSSHQYEEYREVDLTGRALRNDNGEAYPPQPFTRSGPSVTITSNEASYDAGLNGSLVGSINDSAITIAGISCAPKQAILKSASATREFDSQGNIYFIVTRQWDFILDSEDGWQRKIAVKGYYTDEGTDGLKLIRDDEGQALVVPSFLDENGVLLAKGADPVFEDFEFIKEVSFSGIA